MTNLHPFSGLKLGSYGGILVDAPTRFKNYTNNTSVVSVARGGKAPKVYYPNDI